MPINGQVFEAVNPFATINRQPWLDDSDSRLASAFSTSPPHPGGNGFVDRRPTIIGDWAEDTRDGFPSIVSSRISYLMAEYQSLLTAPVTRLMARALENSGRASAAAASRRAADRIRRDVERAVDDALATNVPVFVDIVGHSRGGAVAAEVLRRLDEKYSASRPVYFSLTMLDAIDPSGGPINQLHQLAGDLLNDPEIGTSLLPGRVTNFYAQYACCGVFPENIENWMRNHIPSPVSDADLIAIGFPHGKMRPVSQLQMAGQQVNDRNHVSIADVFATTASGPYSNTAPSDFGFAYSTRIGQLLRDPTQPIGPLLLTPRCPGCPFTPRDPPPVTEYVTDSTFTLACATISAVQAGLSNPEIVASLTADLHPIPSILNSIATDAWVANASWHRTVNTATCSLAGTLVPAGETIWQELDPASLAQTQLRVRVSGTIDPGGSATIGITGDGFAFSLPLVPGVGGSFSINQVINRGTQSGTGALDRVTLTGGPTHVAQISVGPVLMQPCQGQWLRGESVAGVAGPFGVSAIANWDPDGSGPLPQVLVVGGGFAAAGSTTANCIATWNPASGQWSALGTGMTGTMSGGALQLARVIALAVLPNGDLVAAGHFTTAGGVGANNIARWNGMTWSPLGAGTDSEVYSLVVLNNGDLVAAGDFVTAGGVTVNHIARWNGAAWSSFGSGVDGRVYALARLPNGDLVAGGEFWNSGDPSHIARWNGSAWLALGADTGGGTGLNGTVFGLTVLPNGDLVAGGYFTGGSGVTARNIARWNGVAWSPLGGGADSFYGGLVVLPGGDLIAAGDFTSSAGTGASTMARWNGTTWSVFGAGMNPSGSALAVLSSGDLVAGGSFTIAPAVSGSNISRWNGTAWTALGTGSQTLQRPIGNLAVLPNGDLLGYGNYQTNTYPGISRWDGATWSAFPGTGNSGVLAAAVLPGGDLVVGGSFTSMGGVSASRVARWDGTAWSAFGAGVIDSSVLALAVLPNGDLVAGGSFHNAGGVSANRIARWNGTGWSPMGAGMDYEVQVLAVMPNGDLIAGGDFTTAGGVSARGVARWNGTTWSALGSGLGSSNPYPQALAVLPNGDLVVGGQFTIAGGVTVNRIARWNGTAWSAFGTGTNGSVSSLAVLPNGDLVAAGGFSTASGASANNIARWNGTAWSAFDSGTNGQVNSLAVLRNGDLAACGSFVTAGGNVSPYFARWTTRPTCAADFNCSGSLSAQDIFDYLGAWFTLDPRADFNGVNSITPQDIFDYLTAWFAGC